MDSQKAENPNSPNSSHPTIDKLLDHDADGIQEFDNALPKWWLYGFYFTIVFGVVYMYYYHVHTGSDWNFLWYGGRTSDQEYNTEIAEARIAEGNKPKKEIATVALTDAQSIEAGRVIFDGNTNICYTCHRNDLGGQVGPDLTDEYWIHGCDIGSLITSISTGYPDKGMLPYGSGTKLTDQELLQVASYILSRRSSHPENPKAIDPAREVKCGVENEEAEGGDDDKSDH